MTQKDGPTQQNLREDGRHCTREQKLWGGKVQHLTIGIIILQISLAWLPWKVPTFMRYGSLLKLLTED